jgi:hypothetical protein
MLWGAGSGSPMGNNFVSAVTGGGTLDSPYLISVLVLSPFGKQGNLSSGTANNGPDPVAVATSMKQYTLNTLVYGPLQQLKNKTVWYFCGSSPSGAINNWIETGATKGALLGAWGGYAALGIPSDGVGVVPGGIVGGVIGGVSGAGTGALGGAVASGVCSAAGVYH